MKRTVLFLLVLAMSLTLLLSCAKAEPSEIFPEMNFENPETLTFDGAEFVYLVDNDERILGYLDNTLFSDLVLQRISDVENKHDVKIKLERTAAGKTDLVRAEAFTGISTYSAVMDQSHILAEGARANLYYNLALLSSLDALDNEKWGNPEIRKTLFWNNEVYGVFPAKYPLHMLDSIQGLMVVNEQMIRQLNQKDPREYMEEGTWTWDKFEELMPAYTHKDNAGNDVYALYTTVHWLFRTIQTTNGVGVVYKDGDDWKLGIRSPEHIEALNRGYDWAFGEHSPYVYIEPGNKWENIHGNFVNGKSVIALVASDEIYGRADSIAYEMQDFGILTFPNGPSGSAKTPGTTITYCRYVTAIPLFYAEPELAGTVINSLYEPLEGFASFDDTLSYMRQYYFYDDRDVECYRRGYENVMFDYRYEGITDVVINIDESKTMAQWLEQYENSDENNRQKYIINVESSIEELYGDKK